MTSISNSALSRRAKVTVVRVLYSLHDSILMGEKGVLFVWILQGLNAIGTLLPCMKQKNMKLLFKKCISHVDLKVPHIQECGF